MAAESQRRRFATEPPRLGLPQTLLIDRSGVVVKRFPGQITAATFNPAVQALVTG